MRDGTQKLGVGPTALIVMGVSGCGKSTLGALLAERIGCRFLEGDEFHAPSAVTKMRSGIPLTDEDRWPWLDRVGRAADLAVQEDGLAVVACSALRRAYRLRLQGAITGTSRFVMLTNSRDAILGRLIARSHGFMPATLLDSQFDTLEWPTEDECATVLSSDVSPELLCEKSLAWLRSAQHAD